MDGPCEEFQVHNGSILNGDYRYQKCKKYDDEDFEGHRV